MLIIFSYSKNSDEFTANQTYKSFYRNDISWVDLWKFSLYIDIMLVLILNNLVIKQYLGLTSLLFSYLGGHLISRGSVFVYCILECVDIIQ